MSWFFFALLSACMSGTEMFFFNVVAKDKRPATTFLIVYALTKVAASLILYVVTRSFVDNALFLVLIAAINGTVFALASITQVEALKRIPLHIFFPVLRVGSVLIISIFSVQTLREDLTASQTVGLAIAIVSILLLSYTHERNKPTARAVHLLTSGLLLTFISLIFFCGSLITSNIASQHFNFYPFLLVSNTTVLIPMLMYQMLTADTSGKKFHTNKNTTALFGAAAGLSSFIAFITYLEAMRVGPFSLASAVVSFCIIVGIGYTWMFKKYREHITVANFGGIVLAVAALVMMA